MVRFSFPLLAAVWGLPLAASACDDDTMTSGRASGRHDARHRRQRGPRGIASGEQEQGIGQVNRAIGAIDDATRQDAALVEEATAAASAMQEQAEQLQRLVASFVLAAPPAAAMITM